MSRLEHDFLGELTIDDSVYYGVQTLRAMNNFHISGTPLSQFPEMIWALACVKKACALANMELQALPRDIGIAICAACDRILAGNMLDQFPVDCIQGGAGTSTNMNANEVIANLALEIMGHPKGAYTYCHPNNHVNCSQSTNDVYPTALRLALFRLLDYLVEHMIPLQKGFAAKSVEFSHIVKMGRTQLQDAVPMTLGQEFHGYASTLRESLALIKAAAEPLKVQNLGGTAIGTGAAAHPQFIPEACKALCEVTGFDMKIAPDLISASSNTYGMLNFHAALKVSAARLSQICNDLRLMGSGPRCGLHEINLPPRAPGSSIMPGKVNPVIPEVVNQTCFQIIGNDTACTMASEAGQLELNVMEPVIIYNVFNSIHMFTRAMRTLRELCIATVTANPEHTAHMVHNSIGIVTGLLPYIGYKNCTKAAKTALATGKSVGDVLVELGLCTEEEVKKLLVPEEMIHPKYVSKN